MLKAWLLYSLDQVAQQDTRDAADRALAGCDFLLKPLARRRLVQALHAAEQACGRDEDAHVARVAALSVARAETEANLDDLEAVRADYERKLRPAKKPRTGPWLSGSLLLSGVLALSAVLTIRHVTRPFTPRESPVGALFASGLEPVVVALARHDVDAATAIRADVRIDALQPESRQALETLLDRATDVVRDPNKAGDAFDTAAQALNRNLEQAGQPYFVAADTMNLGEGEVPTLLSFYVQERGQYTSGGKPISVLRLWRLDQLNLSHALLGYPKASAQHAFILLDQIEQDLITQLLPAVAPGALMSLTDEDLGPSLKTWEVELQRRGAEILRTHFKAATPEERSDAERVGTLLAKRRALLLRWKESLSGLNMTLRTPRRLVPEADYVSQLELRVPRKDLRDWEAIHDELLSPEVLAAFERIRESYARSVERHEVQHRIDYGRGRFVVPELLARRLHLEDRMGHDLYSRPMRAATELSAYLAEIADHPSPVLPLVAMTRLLFLDQTAGSAHGFAALVAFEGTAQGLGIDTEARWGRSIPREKLARLLYDVCEQKPDAIRRAARKAYEQAFGEPLPKVERGTFTSTEAWRH